MRSARSWTPPGVFLEVWCEQCSETACRRPPQSRRPKFRECRSVGTRNPRARAGHAKVAAPCPRVDVVRVDSGTRGRGAQTRALLPTLHGRSAALWITGTNGLGLMAVGRGSILDSPANQ